MTLALSAALALPGCVALPESPSTATRATLGERAGRAIAADAARLLLQSLPPARTTLRLTRSTSPPPESDAAFSIELTRQLRTHGYAVWDPPEPDPAAPSIHHPTQALAATLRPLQAFGVMHCAVVRVDEVQWARCYHLVADEVRPAGRWTRTVLSTAFP